MQPIEPKFDYLSVKANVSSNTDVVSVIDDKEEYLKELTQAKKNYKKGKSKVGASLGWGWFQGISLFIVGLLLLILGVSIFLMVKDEPLKGGAPKYILARNGIVGAVELNPLWEESKSVIEQSQLGIDPLDSIEKNNISQDKNIDLPKIELASDSVSSLPLDLQAQSEISGTDHANYQITELLEQASQALQALKLMTPKGESAYDYYQNVLKLDANNAMAKAGIKSIVLKYLDLAQEKKNQNDFEKAILYINNALIIDPKNEELLYLKQDVEYWLQNTEAN